MPPPIALGDRRRPAAALLALGALAAYGIALAIALAWVCDDSFVSFRYAQNLVEGRGLVYNAGEHVEGYTNLLWTLLVAGAMKLGFDPLRTSICLGIACYVLLAASLTKWWLRGAVRRGALPLAALLALALDDFHVWATGGLETMLFTLLVTHGMLVAQDAAPSPRRALWAGTLLGASVLTRPDGLIFAAAGVASLALPRPGMTWRAGARRAAVAATPIAVLVGGVVAFKLAYYGEVFPTAFYSKSATDPYYSQGLIYLGLFLARNWFIVPLCAVLLVAGRAELLPAAREEGLLSRVNLSLLGAAALFVAYVTHSGGDFMFARRLVPAVPLLLVVLEDWAARLSAPRWRVGLAAGAVLAAAALPFPIFSQQRPRIAGIADERRFYPAAVIEMRRRQAEIVAAALAGTDARVMFEGGMCMFGYFSRLPYLAEMTGLTQYSLARLPLPRRGHIGHEKGPDDRWLTENRIHLVLSHDPPPVAPAGATGPFDAIYFGNAMRGRIWIYDERIMDRLRERGAAEFMPIADVLAAARREIASASPARAEQVYRLLNRYYLSGAGPAADSLARELRALVESRQRP